MRCDRIYVEWTDPERPGWCCYVSSLAGDFQEALVEFVAQHGPPTLVEFRAHDEGWEPPAPPCADCGQHWALCEDPTHEAARRV